MDHLDSLAGAPRLQPHQFEQAELRDGEALAAGDHHQRGNDGQGQRNLDLDGCALSRRGMHIHGAADFFHVGFHHIHAHAASGNVRHFFGGGKAGKEDQVENVAVGHARRLVGGDHAALDRFPPNAFQVESGTVVRDFDVDLPAFVEGSQDQPARRLLPGLFSVFRRLDPVVDGIPDQVGERVFDGLNNGPVKFRFLALHFDPHFLAAIESQIAHGAGKLAPDVADGLHAGAHDLFLQFAGNQIHALREGLKPGVLGAVGELEQLVARQHQLAHQIHQPVQQGDADAYGFHCRVRISSVRCAASTSSGWAAPCATRISPIRLRPRSCCSRARARSSE